MITSNQDAVFDDSNEYYKILLKSNDYKYLQEKNNDRAIPYHFWHGIKSSKRDEKEFRDILQSLEIYDELKFDKAFKIYDNNKDLNIENKSWYDSTGKPFEAFSANNMIPEKNTNYYPNEVINRNQNKAVLKKNILITGSPSTDWLKFLLENVFQINEPFNDLNKSHYESESYILNIACGLEKASFSFESYRNHCNQIKSNLVGIISIENLNPRPETLLNNAKIFERIFSSDDLNKYLYFFFTSSQSFKVEEIRNSFLQFNEVLRILRLNSNQQTTFVNQRIHLLNENSNKSILNVLQMSNNLMHRNEEEKYNENKISTVYSMGSISDSKKDQQYSYTYSKNDNYQGGYAGNNYYSSHTYSQPANKVVRKKNILITGSPSTDWLKFLLENVFQINEPFNDLNKSHYESESYILNIACGLEKASFSFESYRNHCNQIKSNLVGIISIENLNPRPETLLNNAKIFERIFSSDDLNKYLYFFFTSSQSFKVEEIRNSFLQFNEVLRILRLNSNQQTTFVNQRIHLLNESSNKSILNVLQQSTNEDYNQKKKGFFW